MDNIYTWICCKEFVISRKSVCTLTIYHLNDIITTEEPPNSTLDFIYHLSDI